MSYKEAPVVTTRPASTSIFGVSSKDRFPSYVQQRFQIGVEGPNASPYDFTITKSENLLSGFFTRMAVTEFSMDWVIPNVNRYTDAIKITFKVSGESAVTSTFFADIGFYTPNAFATVMQAHIRALDSTLAGFDFIYDTFDQPYFEYATNSTTQIAFAPLSNVPDTQKQLFDMLGFNVLNQTLATAGQGVSTFFVYTDYFDVVSSQMSYNQPLKDSMTQPVVRDTLCRVYLNQINGQMNANTLQVTNTNFTPTGCTPFQIYHNYTHPKQINWTPNQNIGQVRFTLYDDGGNPLSAAAPLYADGNWQMTLLVTEN